MGPCERAVQGLQADVAAHGETIDGRPYTVNRTVFEEYMTASIASTEAMDMSPEMDHQATEVDNDG